MSRTAQRAASRERILDAAAAAFRRRGYAATGVDAVMAEAGLTHGGFYAHFPSKAELLRAAVAHATRPVASNLVGCIAGLSGDVLVATAITRYLSLDHRDHPERGCPIPTLGAELPRLEPAVAGTMGGPVQGLARLLAPHLAGADAAPRAQALAALLVGGVVTARALPDAEAGPWLASCRAAARTLAGLPNADPATRP